MTELSSVRGSWPREAVVVASQKSFAEGWTIGIEDEGTVGDVFSGARVDRRIPMLNTIMAYGSLGYANVNRSSTAAATTQSKLSPHQGPVHVKGSSIFEPALKQSESPAPTWIPFTTGIGVTRFAQLIRPVILNSPTNPATTSPAAAFSSSVNLRAIATAAMAFMGCTGSGSPNATPVKMFAAPVKSKVDGNEIEFVSTNAVISGRSVPKSPSEPESSASGWDLMVSRLCLWTPRSRETGVDGNGMALGESQGCGNEKEEKRI
jgi:hypothetical protein